MTTRASLSELSDSALIRRVRGGDEDGFRALYQRHSPALYLLLIRLLGGNSLDADDVLQDTWLACCEGLHGFRGDAAFATWLTRIAIRLARGRMKLAHAGDDFVDDVPAPEPPFSAATRIDLDRAMRRLPDHQRAILVLHDVEGFTHEEIAEHLAIPVGTSKVTLSRARAAMRRLLSDGVPA